VFFLSTHPQVFTARSRVTLISPHGISYGVWHACQFGLVRPTKPALNPILDFEFTRLIHMGMTSLHKIRSHTKPNFNTTVVTGIALPQ
jgi:hypothetical protein